MTEAFRLENTFGVNLVELKLHEHLFVNLLECGVSMHKVDSWYIQTTQP